MTRLLTRDFPLRRDLIVRMTLPVVMTMEDAERLDRFVHALVMGPDSMHGGQGSCDDDYQDHYDSDGDDDD